MCENNFIQITITAHGHLDKKECTFLKEISKCLVLFAVKTYFFCLFFQTVFTEVLWKASISLIENKNILYMKLYQENVMEYKEFASRVSCNAITPPKLLPHARTHAHALYTVLSYVHSFLCAQYHISLVPPHRVPLYFSKWKCVSSNQIH